jgi:hypothetical protein
MRASVVGTVWHATEDTIVPTDVARYVAESIPGARLVELPAPRML